MDHNILIIEDDLSVSEMIKDYLIKEGYKVATAFEGEKGMQKFLTGAFDLIILDIMMPKLDGIEVMKQIRKESSVPILIVSAKDKDVEKVLGLELGADDYIAKPFSMLELSARVKAILRRATNYSEVDKEENIINYRDLTIDINNFSVKKHGKEIKLTAKEFNILKMFLKYPNNVFTKAQIYTTVWDNDYFDDENVINVHIRRLREKIEDNPAEPTYIKTIWGIGYKLGE
ncbi:response regulator transcription factor [Amphibacillus sp. Q70]|uniref:response regulator transcription factor n=1 Tax=Amphibacillus sp. Q70 TaxID=3453416 RepID=UPI003F82C000